MKSITKAGSDLVLEAAKKAAAVSLMFLALATGISYIAYACDLAVSAWPWRIGLAVMLVCSLAPFLVYLKARRTNAMWAFGTIVAIWVFAVYYFFGIFAYFYYFVFSPMRSFVRWPGLLGGGLLTIYWLFITQRNVRHTIEHPRFLKSVFIDDGKEILYDIYKGMRNFERLHKEKLPFPKIYLYLVYGLAPFSLILNRLLAPTFGSTGVLLLMAVLGMPVSLWFAALLVRVCLLMVVLPIRIEREQRRHVVVTTR